MELQVSTHCFYFQSELQNKSPQRHQSTQYPLFTPSSTSLINSSKVNRIAFITLSFWWGPAGGAVSPSSVMSQCLRPSRARSEDGTDNQQTNKHIYFEGYKCIFIQKTLFIKPAVVFLPVTDQSGVRTQTNSSDSFNGLPVRRCVCVMWTS